VSNGLNFPDNLYADHLAKQTPTGAYRSTEVVSDAEAKLRTALAYINHARDLITAALDQPTSCNATIQPVSGIESNPPKWHVSWGKPKRDELPLNLTAAVSTPNAIPVESSYLDSFSPNGSRIATADEIADMRSVLSAEELKGFGIGDVPHESGTADIRCDMSGNVNISRHVMNAAALQDADEYNRGTGDTGV
jgi:hypothetical protein